MKRNSQTVEDVHAYWNSNTLGLQYLSDSTLKPGTPEFFAHIQPWMNPYKFPWIMQRIEREAEILRGKQLLAAYLEMHSNIGKDCRERADTERGRLRNRKVMFAMLVGSQAKMAAGLASDGVAELSKSLSKITSRQIAGKPHTAITSSRTW